MKKTITFIFVIVMSFVLSACPPSQVRKADAYVEGAKTFVKQFNEEYPNVANLINSACKDKLINEESCSTFAKVDPLVLKGALALEEALKQYQEAINQYEALVKVGASETETEAAWSKVSATVSVVIGKMSEITSLYFQVLSIYSQAKAIPVK